MFSERCSFGKAIPLPLSNRLWSNVAGSRGVVKYRLSHEHIVLDHESESTYSNRLTDIEHVRDGRTLGISYPVWDMGVRMLVVVAGNWGIGTGLIHDIGWEWITITIWPREDLTMIAKIDIRAVFSALMSIDWFLFFSYFACLYRLTLFGICQQPLHFPQ